MIYSNSWDLQTIPDDVFFSEANRRRAERPHGLTKLQPCKKCGQALSARRRRLPCPEHLTVYERTIAMLERAGR